MRRSKSAINSFARFFIPFQGISMFYHGCHPNTPLGPNQALKIFVLFMVPCAWIIPIKRKNATPPVYYSLGQDTNDHKTGSPTATISPGATASRVTQIPTPSGVGDRTTLAQFAIDHIGVLFSPTSELSMKNVSRKYASAPHIKAKYKLDGAALIIEAKDKNSVRTEVGDPAKTEFTPELKISRWEGEVSFKIKPDVSQAPAKDKRLNFDG